MQTPSSDDRRPFIMFFDTPKDMERMVDTLKYGCELTFTEEGVPEASKGQAILIHLTQQEMWAFTECPGVTGIGETKDTKARFISERRANPVNYDDPFVVAYQKELFPKMFEIEHGVGEWVNWRTTSIGFFIGRGMAVDKAVELALRLFPNVKSSHDHRSRQQHTATGTPVVD